MNKEHFLQPGEIFFSESPSRVITILGSCVSVCIFDKKKKTGGICHYYLPTRTDKNDDPSDRYGEYAIVNLLKCFKKNGSDPQDLIAKIIGGGNVLSDATLQDMNIGKENIKIAKKILNDFKINIFAQEVGGARGKKIRFFTHTGEIQWKEVEPTKVTKKDGEARKNIEIIKRKIKVMIVDDSSPVRKLMRKMIESHSDFEVVAEAPNPIIAQELIKKDRPDVMTLDINMPEMDGVTFLKKFMKTDPIPTIMVTSFSFDDSGPVFQALEEGALDYIQKPGFSEIASVSEELGEKLKAAYLARNKIKKVITNVSKISIQLSSTLLNNWLVAIGSSTGGTEALKELLIRLPSNIPPIVIVQHIPPVFSKAFADRMNAICDFEVKEAQNGDEIKPGRVLLAPGAKQMKVKAVNHKLIVEINDDPPVNRFKPSVDYLFHSLENVKKKKIIGIILTGMGSDGAKGLLALKQNGAYTIGQDESSSVVYGMPKVAFETGALHKQVSLLDIPRELSERIV